MTVPALVLMVTTVVSILILSLHDHAGFAAAGDLADLRASHAAEAFLASCLTELGCQPPHADQAAACASGDGISVTATVNWNPSLWKTLTPVAGVAVIAYDEGLDNNVRAFAAASVNAC